MTYTLPASWQPLKAHSATMASTSMLDLFADNPNRAAEFSLDAAGLTLDYSKNLVDARTLALLGQLYAECQLGSGVEAMFNGVRVNNTEDRAALHTLLRASQAAATGPLAKEYAEVQASLQSVKRISDAVRAGQWLGCTGKPITHILHLGIGGSYLGPRMVDEALSAYADAGIHCDYVANVDGQHIDQVLKRLDQATTLVIIVSKSFATVETRVNAQSAQDWLQQVVPLAQRHLHAVAVTSNVAAAKDFGIAAENILPMWDWVGGRYSLWSAVSLPIAIKYGFARFEALLAGAASMDEHFRSAAWPNNMPMLLAAIGVLYRNFMNIGSHAILPYDHSLRLLPAHLQQLDMESNGKSVSTAGDLVPLQTGPIIWGGEGTNGQHAFHQLLHQGSRFTSIDFILPLQPHHQRQEHHNWLVANCLSQSQALMQGRSREQLPETLSDLRRAHMEMPGNRPSNTIVMAQVTPASLGALIALYEHKVFCQARIWQINPFDQWGVELGKQLSETIYATINENSAPSQATSLDPSTQRLLSLYQNHNRSS